MKTSELIGNPLAWAVAKCEGLRVELDHQYTEDHKFNGWWQCGPNHWQPLCKYSTDWSKGGPIIEREQIGLDPTYCDGKLDGWRAAGHDLEYDENGDYIDGSDHMQYGPTPLIAAMRCYVASKLGDEVDIPKELLGEQ